MGENTAIEWADHTFNPWTGCTKVSEACRNCYAEALAKRFPHLGGWGPGAPRKRTSVANWRKPLTWNRKAEAEIAVGCARRRVFCASLADWLDPEVPAEWLADLLALIGETPNLIWMLLTKRPHLWISRMEAAIAVSEGEDPSIAWVCDWVGGREEGGPLPPPNVWIGVTAEDQRNADERIPRLLSIPARVRFLSCEPLLGPLDIGAYLPGLWCDRCERNVQDPHHAHASGYRPHGIPCDGIDWVICGGESGPGARPMHPDWARSLRDQCQAAGVAFFFKQWGDWIPVGLPLADVRGTRHHEFDDGMAMARLGKKAAGRLLDGREWNEVPQC